MSASPGSHSGPNGAAVIIRGCMFSGNNESSVKYILVLLYLSEISDHRQRRRRDGFRFDIRGLDAMIPLRLYFSRVLARSFTSFKVSNSLMTVCPFGMAVTV